MIKKLGFAHFDWALLGGMVFIACASLVTLGSAGGVFFWRQFVFYVVAFFIIILGSQWNWRLLWTNGWFRYGFYSFSVALVAVTYVLPRTIRGTKSWITFAGFQFEPVELVKLALIFVFAYFFSKRHLVAWQWKTAFASLLLTAFPALLILKHPDFGGAFTVMVIWATFFLMGGIHTKRFFIGVVVAMLACVALWSLVLKPYQKDRITGFLSPEKDPLGINYNVIQSKIAIGSAGFFGKGFGGGTQVLLGFLPEAQTDFLFSAFVEEWGVLGGILLLLTFFGVVYRIIIIGSRARDNYARLFSLGTSVFLLVHFAVNVGSTLGMVPVAGVTFPFFSYGGSNLLTTAVLLGIIEHIKLESS